MDGKRIIVTGGAGYIGSHTVVELINNGYEPIIIDDFSNSYKSVLDRIQRITGEEVHCIERNCMDHDRLMLFVKKLHQEKPIHGILHFAASKSVNDSVSMPYWYYKNNVNSLLNIIDLMRVLKINNLVFSSSCTVYGEPESYDFVDENTPLQPAESPYGDTKVVCENIVKFASKAYGLKTTSLRYFNPIGAHPSGYIGDFGDDYDTPDGTCIRDYIHVCDLATAHIKALEYLETQEEPNSVFNVGTGKGTSVLELINYFKEATALMLDYKIGDRRDGDIMGIYANPDKLMKLTGWEAKYNIKEALEHAYYFKVSQNGQS
jgi:UDP-glucose 4-epimerase